MPNITINTCDKTPNIDALEAIQKFILRNYLSRDYQKTRAMTVKSSRVISVTENNITDKGSPCDASFTCRVR